MSIDNSEFEEDSPAPLKEERILSKVEKKPPEGESQENGVVSRLLKLSNEYFCEVIRILFDWEDQAKKSVLKAIYIEFNARGSGSLGLLSDPLKSTLHLHLKGKDPVILEPSENLSFISSRKICQIHGYLCFEVSLTSDEIKSTTGKFSYAKIVSNDEEYTFSEVFLLFPGSIVESEQMDCPLESCGGVCCVEDTINLFHAGHMTSNTCENCKLEKTGFHNNCLNCTKSFCHDCYGGKFNDLMVGKGDCKNHKLKPVQDIDSSASLCLAGWKRQCDNCQSMVTYNENQLCSYFLHCDSCNFNLCRACSFHPAIKYLPIMIDTRIQKDFTLKLTGHESDVSSMYIFSDLVKGRTLLITTSWDNTAIVWDLESGLKYRTFSSGDWLRDCRLLNHDIDGVPTLIAITVGDDSTAVVWDVDKNKELCTFYGHSGYIYTVEIIPMLHVFGDDNIGKAGLQAATDPRPDDRMNRRTSAFGMFMAKGKSRQIINAVITGGKAGEVYVWDLTTGEPIKYKQEKAHEEGNDEYDEEEEDEYDPGIIEDIDDDINALLSLPIQEDRNRILISTDTGMWMYDISSSPATRSKKYSTGGDKVYYLHQSDQNGRACVVGCGYAESRSISVWDLETTEMIFKLKCTQMLTCSTLLKKYDDSGPTVIAGCVDGQLVVWDDDSGHNRPRSLPSLDGEIDFVAVYTDLSSNLPVLIATVEGTIYVSLLGDNDSKITSSLLTKELKRSIVDDPVTNIVCCLEKDKEKKIIALIDTVIGTVDVLVAVTAAKYLVIDLFTGTVLCQQDFKGFYCTAADVIGNSSVTDFIPWIACGGFVDVRFTDADDENAAEQPVKKSKLPNQVKIYDLMNGTFIKSISWETSIVSLSCFLHGKNQEPFVVTIGKYENLLVKENRLICWQVSNKLPSANVFYDKITKENEKLKRKIILSYESKADGEEKYYKFYDKMMETAWMRGNFTSMDVIMNKAYDYYLCRPTLVVITEDKAHKPTVYHLPSLVVSESKALTSIANRPIETWTTFSSHEWNFGNDLSRKLVCLLSSSIAETASSSIRKSSSFRDDPENSLVVYHVLVEELGLDRNKLSKDFFISFKKADFKNEEKIIGKCYQLQVAGSATIEYIVMLFEDEFKPKSSILESSLLVVHNVKKKKSKTFHVPHKGNKVLNILPYMLLESVQKDPLVFLVLDSGIIRCINSALDSGDKTSSEDANVSAVHRFVDPLKFLAAFVGEIKDIKATKDNDWPKTLRRIYNGLLKEEYDDDKADEEDTDSKDENAIEDMEKFFNDEFWSRYEQIVYHAADKKLDDFFVQMKPFAAPYCHNFNRALDIAIKNNSIRIVRLLLDYWLVILNQEATDKDFVYDWFHRPSAFLPINSLISLVYSGRKDFVRAFISFICMVQLIKSPKIMKGDNEVLRFSSEETMMITGSISYSESIDIWRSSKLDGIKAPSTNFEACFIPIRNVGTLEMLSAFVRASDTLGDLSIFSNDVGKYATMFAWEKYGYRLHIWETFKYIVFMLLYSTAAFNFDSWIHQSDPIRYYAIWVIEALVGLFLAYYMINEFNEIQFSSDVNVRATDKVSVIHMVIAIGHFIMGSLSAIYNEIGGLAGGPNQIRNGLNSQALKSSVETGKDIFYQARQAIIGIVATNLEYFTEFWNVVDWTFISTGLTGTLLRLILQRDNAITISFLAIGAVGTWFKLLYYFLPYENSGRLVSAILRMCFEMTNFLIVLAVVIFGFAESFWLLSYPRGHLSFGNARDALINTYFLMFGQFPGDIEDTRSKELFYVLIVAFSLIVIILMLNLLIALLNDSYAKVRDVGEAQWRFDQARIILEESNVLENFYFNFRPELPYVHIIKRAEKDEDKGKEAETVARIDELTKKVDVLLKAKDTKLDDLTEKLSVLMNELSNISGKKAEGDD